MKLIFAIILGASALYANTIPPVPESTMPPTTVWPR